MIRFFAAHPTAANLLMVAIIVIGLVAAPNIRRETFPELPPNEIQVRIPYPGANAEEVENAVCQRVEDSLDGINDLDEVRCEAIEGIGTAIAEMRDGGDFDRFLNDVKTEVEAIDSFPEEVELPIVKQLGLTDFVVAVAVTGSMSAPDLKAYAEELKDRLVQVEVVSQVTVRGFSDHQIRIEVPAQMLRQYGLSVSDIADVIARQSVDLPLGAIETSNRDVLVRFIDQRRTAAEFRDLVVVAGQTGAEIRLDDIATITDRFEEDGDKIVFNGRRAAILDVTKTRTEDTLTVVDAVAAFIEEERRHVAPGVEFALTRNISSIVRDRINMLLRNGGQGLVLVFLTMWLFFSFRFSFWVAMGLPVSFLGTIFAMSVIGYSFDMITMVGLLIAVGLLMDDAIVIAENIATHFQRGKSPIEAAVDGTREVAPGVVASFVTTVCIFGSLAFLKGHIGDILKVMPVILIVTLAVSFAEAFLILPHHLVQSQRRAGEIKETAFRRRFEAGLAWIREHLLGRAVDAAIRWRYLTAGAVLGLFLASLSLVAGGTLKFVAFPDIDGNVVEARVLLPQGTPLARTEAVVGRVTAAMKRVDARLTPEQPGGSPFVRNVAIQYGKNIDAYETGAHVATVTLDLLNAEERTGRLDDMLNMWRRELGALPDVIAINFTELFHGPAGRALEIRLGGLDLEELKAASMELQQWLGGYQGVFDLSDDLRPGKPEVRIRLREGAKALGLDATSIAAQLRSAFFGRTASEIQVGAEAFEIDVRLDAADRDSIADLEYFAVTAPGGEQVPLGAVAILGPGRGYARIARVDGRRTVTVIGEVDPALGNVAEIVGDTRQRFLGPMQERHPGVRVTFLGQSREGARTGASIRTGFTLGLIGVFVLLAFLFKSYVEPVVVMAAIPLGLIGVIWGHVLMGLDLSMPSVVGFASLAGIVVNDSILLVAFVKIRRRRGESIPEAARMASRERLRAVLLTSLTTIAGLSPLLAEQSLQAQVMIPLVTSLAFGLMASTVLVLVVVPAFYVILDDFGLCAKIGRDEPAPAPATVGAATG